MTHTFTTLTQCFVPAIHYSSIVERKHTKCFPLVASRVADEVKWKRKEHEVQEEDVEQKKKHNPFLFIFFSTENTNKNE